MATRRRVVLLVLLLAAAGATLFAGVVRGLPAPDASLSLPWLAWMATFAAAEVFVVHVQLQRDSHRLLTGSRGGSRTGYTARPAGRALTVTR